MMLLQMGIFLLLSALGLVAGRRGCHIPYGPGEAGAQRVAGPLPHDYLRKSDLPLAFDWRAVNGTSFVGPARTQKNPNLCG